MDHTDPPPGSPSATYWNLRVGPLGFQNLEKADPDGEVLWFCCPACGNDDPNVVTGRVGEAIKIVCPMCGSRWTPDYGPRVALADQARLRRDLLTTCVQGVFTDGWLSQVAFEEQPQILIAELHTGLWEPTVADVECGRLLAAAYQSGTADAESVAACMSIGSPRERTESFSVLLAGIVGALSDPVMGTDCKTECAVRNLGQLVRELADPAPLSTP
ncbi:hypothetical protein [Kitasatospora aureofaciens]|uniref:hypothetical protein n=1 Tax=Kitasatospora aureofaciens TaxID=1894 RepID=UPI0033F2519C